MENNTKEFRLFSVFKYIPMEKTKFIAQRNIAPMEKVL